MELPWSWIRYQTLIEMPHKLVSRLVGLRSERDAVVELAEDTKADAGVFLDADLVSGSVEHRAAVEKEKRERG